MAKIINIGKHCSECKHYEPCADYRMFCKYLKHRITSKKTPKYCKGFQLY